MIDNTRDPNEPLLGEDGIYVFQLGDPNDGTIEAIHDLLDEDSIEDEDDDLELEDEDEDADEDYEDWLDEDEDEDTIEAMVDLEDRLDDLQC